MKVGIITFHAAHNYGSMLQAYALQKTVESLGHTCEIVNFRTSRQKRMYRPFPLIMHWLPLLKALLFPKLALDDVRKHRLFEKFLRESLQTTKRELSSARQLAAARFDYDAYISGSDQIWNTHCGDFDSAYFLDFVSSAVKIAYAPSMGPCPETVVTEGNDAAIRRHLSTYRFLSVREEGSAERIERITGTRPSVCLDPTLLLSREDWYAMTDDASPIQGDYLLLYTPRCDERLYDKAVELAERYDLKVVATLSNHYSRYRKNRRMEFYTAVGPKEFLTLVRFSTLVVCKSFHAVVFSLIFARPFYVMDGMDDSRVSNLLGLTGLEAFAECPTEKMPELGNEVFARAFALLQPFKEQSIKFLQHALS